MADAVNTKRRYSSALREGQARQTQEAVLDAARGLFVEQGWGRTTIAAVARKAGVSPETIYSVFGNKRSLLERLVQNAVRGNAPDMPLLAQAASQQVAGAKDQNEQLRLFATSICAILDRVAPLVAVARAAAESDPQLWELYRVLHEGRRRNLMFVAEALSRKGSLRADMSLETATDHIFRLASPELFLLMRDMEGCSLKEISNWLAEALAELLLPPLRDRGR